MGQPALSEAQRGHTMNFVKITSGVVEQTFNDAGECIAQEFFAGDCIGWKDEEGDLITQDDVPLAGREYQDFTMVQP